MLKRNLRTVLVMLGLVAASSCATVPKDLRAPDFELMRIEMKSEGLIYGESHFPVSMTLLVALALLVVGILAMLSIQLDVGPFG